MVRRGVTMARQVISRNSLCPCGSGKKFKLCCLRAGSSATQTPSSRLNGGGPVSFPLRQTSPRPAVTPPADQREWHEVQAVLEMPSGEAFVAVMVYSRQWIRAKNLTVGSPIPLNIPKHRLRGEGRIQSIQPAKTIPPGEGLVLGVAHLGKPDTRSGPRLGERLPPVGHEWLPLVLSQVGGVTSDLRLIRPTAWMDANWHRLEELENDRERPADVTQWRLVHLSVSVQGGRKVHLSLFWERRAVEAYRLTVGEPVLLRMPQHQLSGEGTLTATDPAPFVPEPGTPQGMISLPGKEGGPGKGAIETTEVGDYVTTYTHEERRDRLPIDHTQGKWVARQRIRLRLEKEDGGHSKVVLLRDAKWVRTERAVVGGTVHLNMPEMACVGDARVEEVEPCLVFLRWGDSSIRMVTGTFAHSAGLCGDLRLKGESKPIGVTAKHPIWSEDRLDWVPAGELRPGETVKTLKGTTTVVSYTLCDRPEPTFNMEVEGDHVFRVGDQGILVHNSSITKCSEVPKCGEGSIEKQDAFLKAAAAKIYSSLPFWRAASSIAVGLAEPISAKEDTPWTCVFALNIIGRPSDIDPNNPTATGDLATPNGVAKWYKDHKKAIDEGVSREFALVSMPVGGEVKYHHSEAQLVDWVRLQGYKLCVLANLPLTPCKDLAKNNPEINCQDRLENYQTEFAGQTCSNGQPFRFILINSAEYKALKGG